MRRWKRIVSVPYGSDELVDMAAEYVAANVAKDMCEAERKQHRDRLLKALCPGEAVTFEDEDGTVWVVQRVDRTTEKIDEFELLKHLTDEQFEIVTKPRLDKSLLADAIEDGLIDAQQVAPFYFEDTTATIRASKKKLDDGGE